MSLGDEHGHKAYGVRRYDLSLQCSAVGILAKSLCFHLVKTRFTRVFFCL
jgi:hypothetical protein